MKRLLIIRHAKSSWKFAGLSDKERPLNERGLRDAPFMAKTLVEKGILPDLMVTSNAVRAMTTAAIFAQNIGYSKGDLKVKPEIYEASIETIYKVVESFDDTANTVFVFGHNPTFTYFANEFLNEPISNIPTCGIVAIEFDIENWGEIRNSNFKCLFFDFPKNHRKSN
jgi:phosphohistidine phosphatase